MKFSLGACAKTALTMKADDFCDKLGAGGIGFFCV